MLLRIEARIDAQQCGLSEAVDRERAHVTMAPGVPYDQVDEHVKVEPELCELRLCKPTASCWRCVALPRGWTGDACERRRCPRSCGHGTCDLASGACKCESGWTGASCDLAACPSSCVHGACRFECRCETHGVCARDGTYFRAPGHHGRAYGCTSSAAAVVVRLYSRSYSRAVCAVCVLW